jgi:hypothetical protein
MRRLFSIGLYVVAGFFLYAASLLAFIADTSIGEDKWIVVGIFLVPAVLALGIGLALARFQHWTRDVGTVFLSAAGVTTFLIFTVACLFMSEESRKIMPPEILTFFSDYVAGGAVILVFVVIGGLLLLTSVKSRAPKHPPELSGA